MIDLIDIFVILHYSQNIIIFEKYTTKISEPAPLFILWSQATALELFDSLLVVMVGEASQRLAESVTEAHVSNLGPHKHCKEGIVDILYSEKSQQFSFSTCFWMLR